MNGSYRILRLLRISTSLKAASVEWGHPLCCRFVGGNVMTERFHHRFLVSFKLPNPLCLGRRIAIASLCLAIAPLAVPPRSSSPGRGHQNAGARRVGSGRDTGSSAEQFDDQCRDGRHGRQRVAANRAIFGPQA